MHAITVRISLAQQRLAILYALLFSLRTLSVLAIGVVLLAGIFAFHPTSVLVSSAATGITIGLGAWIALNAALFAANIKASKHTTPFPQNFLITYVFTTAGCEISTKDASKKIPRSDFRRLLRRPCFFLLEIVEGTLEHEPSNPSAISLHPYFAQSKMSAAAKTAFPIVSLLPLSSRSFLILPKASFGPGEIAFISRIPRHPADS